MLLTCITSDAHAASLDRYLDGQRAHLTLDISQGLQLAAQPTSDLPDEQSQSTPSSTDIQTRIDTPAFGKAGSRWITLGGGWANNLDRENDFNAHVAVSWFLADELEFSVELGGWYFDQIGEDTGGINWNLIFRWHFWHDEEYDWTVYGDVGIGVLFGFDLVPDGGTGFNFTPRAGFGFTKRINESGTRFQLGVRYHHISNGRIEGDIRNPSRDSVMVYAGLVIPW